ncbi:MULTISPECIES: hypothetical protein [Streptomyces]|uniref:Uncharacterized protein n=3 Tax=Streptomyces TaxID=1883 RepID=A0A3S9PM88_STRLT|nr:hypothetical protein [Streptomyces luteoverticillatus]AZQ73458.1 hypothetical protein EKH77_21575 [Streptomyces luteoverticillatus]
MSCNATLTPTPEQLNHEIRMFLTARSGRTLTSAERGVYERLRAEWLAAGRRARYGTAPAPRPARPSACGARTVSE